MNAANDEKIDQKQLATASTARRTFLAGAGTLLLSTRLRAQPSDAPVVETSLGRLRGALEPNGALVFRGIPYASAPERFQAPRPVSPWPGIRDATRFGAICPQPVERVAGQSEIAALFATTLTAPLHAADEACLVLNVWTSALDARKRPVLFWIHGGGFESGAASYSTYWGDGLAATGEAVVVSVNHRLNALGYLYLAELGGPRYRDSGMAGMLDIVAALQWVRDNIAAFGGDPESVTIFGQSGGGAKVATLLAMPAAQGLFHRAICQSGTSVTALSPDAATRTAAAYLAALDLPASQSDRLSTLPVAQLLAAYAKVGSLLARTGRIAPVVDGLNLPRAPFAPDAPALARDVPLIIGCTTGEGTIIGAMPSDFALGDSQLAARISTALGIATKDAQLVEAAARADMPRASAADLFFRILSDSVFGRSATLCADRKAAQPGAAAVYAYLFDWQAPALGSKYRAFHGSEHPFVFRHLASASGLQADPAMKKLEDAMSGAWLSFARSGNPNHPGLPEWRRYDPATRSTMMFGDTCVAVDNPYPKLRAAMDALPLGFFM